MLRCDECFYTKFYKSDKKPHNGVRWWRCGRCGHVQLGYKPFVKAEPRELYIDIETSPNLALLYDLKVSSGYVNSDMILKDWFIISWSAEWMNCYGHKNFSRSVKPAAAKKWSLSWLDGTDSKPDADILQPLRDLLNEADLVWGHNYKRFDRKKINTRFMVNGIAPPEKYKMVDTLQVARANFAYASNKLEFINTRLGNNPKLDVSLDDWKSVLRGEKETIDKVLKYNIGDVKEGIAMTKKMREWINPFPITLQYVREG